MKPLFIFLDIDGPINTLNNIWINKCLKRSTSSYKIKLPREQLERLAIIVRETNAKLILSSSWRLVNLDHAIGNISPARRNLENQLKDFGLHISGQTPNLGDRGLEITTWLRKYEKIRKIKPGYIIIDDKLDISGNHDGHIIYCNPYSGITDSDVELAINLLKEQQFSGFRQ